MKRPLFVFAGQSNMMGAAVYPAKEQIAYTNSYEYLHKPRRFGRDMGEFKSVGFPVGEFTYRDLQAAYGQTADPTAVSSLANYTDNTLFGPAMCNLLDDEQKTTVPFASFSEQTVGWAPALPPYFVQKLEGLGYACAYAHIAKGSVSITYYLEGEVAAYFDEKVTDFFADATARFSEDDTGDKVLVWLQGCSDAVEGYEAYRRRLDALWERAKGLGFTCFFMIRVGYWGDDRIAGVMQAQEDFCTAHPDAYMLTRVCSYMVYKGQDMEAWYATPPSEEALLCRDSFYGFDNQHINEKGFRVIARHAVPNAIRVIYENKQPQLEQELLRPLL
ncbi:MAG: hypothetical protein IJ518_00045 [Clostridia bacterium]|nr:hypothetical protein [Clostridia bacterium]